MDSFGLVDHAVAQQADIVGLDLDDVTDGEPVGPPGRRARLRTLVNTPSVLCAYVGSGLQLFVAGSKSSAFEGA